VSSMIAVTTSNPVGAKGLDFYKGQSTQSSHKILFEADGQIDDSTTPGLHLDLVRSTVPDRS
jgi:hypothetical protein